MRIALCHENVLPNRGGAEMYVADLARCLSARGQDVHLYASRWDAAALPAELKCHQLDVPSGPRSTRPHRFNAAVADALKRDRPDVSIGFDKCFATDFYYPLGGLQVATADGNLNKYRSPFARNFAQFLRRFDFAHQSFVEFEREHLTKKDRPKVIANSAWVRSHLVRYYNFATADVPVIHNAIDPNRFDERNREEIRGDARREWKIKSCDVTAAFVAMNYGLKGLEPLLRAMAELPVTSSLQLIVAGSTDFKGYRRLSKRLGVANKVRFVGHCADVKKVFFAADFHVHPTFYDPCSLVVLEALACGLPVITTTSNGAAERMNPPDDGIVIDDPHDSKTFANALQRMMNNQLRGLASQAARASAQRWTFDHHCDALLGVLEGRAAVRKSA